MPNFQIFSTESRSSSIFKRIKRNIYVHVISSANTKHFPFQIHFESVVWIIGLVCKHVQCSMCIDSLNLDTLTPENFEQRNNEQREKLMIRFSSFNQENVSTWFLPGEFFSFFFCETSFFAFNSVKLKVRVLEIIRSRIRKIATRSDYFNDLRRNNEEAKISKISGYFNLVKFNTKQKNVSNSRNFIANEFEIKNVESEMIKVLHFFLIFDLVKWWNIYFVALRQDATHQTHTVRVMTVEQNGNGKSGIWPIFPLIELLKCSYNVCLALLCFVSWWVQSLVGCARSSIRFKLVKISLAFDVCWSNIKALSQAQSISECTAFGLSFRILRFVRNIWARVVVFVWYSGCNPLW